MTGWHRGGWGKIQGFAKRASLTGAVYDIGFTVKANRFRLTTASLLLCLPFGVPDPGSTGDSGMAIACWAKSRRNKPKGLLCHCPQKAQTSRKSAMQIQWFADV